MFMCSSEHVGVKVSMWVFMCFSKHVGVHVFK